MRLFRRRLVNNFRYSCLAGILFLLVQPVATGQEGPAWDKKALRDSVIALLTDYQFIHNQLNAQAGVSIERAFIHLFSNPKVKVINSLEKSPAGESISIEDYMVKVIENYPSGLIVNADLGRLSVGNPVYDRNNRYILSVRVNLSGSGISGGKVLSVADRVIFQIAFFQSSNGATTFSIYGIEKPDERQSFLCAGFSSGLTGYHNAAIAVDQRLAMISGTGYSGGIRFIQFFSDYLGAGVGASFTSYTGTLTLDRYDPTGGFDPNMSEIAIENNLWFAEVPLFLAFRTNPSWRLGLRIDAGISLGFRTFEEAWSSAINNSTGKVLTGVFSDIAWIGELERFNASALAAIALNYRISPRLGMQLEAGMRQGFTGLDNYSRADYVTGKYHGQFNPLWAAPDKTTSQAIFVGMGVSFRLNSDL